VDVRLARVGYPVCLCAFHTPAAVAVASAAVANHRKWSTGVKCYKLTIHPRDTSTTAHEYLFSKKNHRTNE
jgi:hypothetical protein